MDFDPYEMASPPEQPNLWSGFQGSFTRIMGLSALLSFFTQANMFGSVKLLILGSIIETGRRLCKWLMERFRIQYSMTAQFDEGDPAYEWIVLFLTQENVWRRSRDFRVTANNSKRKWNVKTSADPQVKGNAEYVPTFEVPQLFRWKGYWIEIKRNKGAQAMPHMVGHSSSTIFITIYTLDLNVLSMLVEDARKRYIEVSRPNVIVHIADMANYGPAFVWNNAKSKTRRPLNSIILQEGTIEGLIEDVREFIKKEDWYIRAGIPHRRGYLLHGPPGTGKSSTIYALAGELGMEIFSLSLASSFVDDSFLQRAASSVPKHSILLIEDIDCAFPSREELENESYRAQPHFPGMVMPSIGRHRRSAVTLSGLLNMIDGVGSEEGKLFFATTNYIDQLDPALLRPGRIDRKIAYHLATQAQASALFKRFFPHDLLEIDDLAEAEKGPFIDRLAESFASKVPENEFSTAELQGFLLSCKTEPEKAAVGVSQWVEEERTDRKERAEREAERKRKSKGKQEQGLGVRSPPFIGGYPPMSMAGFVGGGMSGAVTEPDTLSRATPSSARSSVVGDLPLPAKPSALVTVQDVEAPVVTREDALVDFQ